MSTSKERVSRFRTKQKGLDRTKRDYYLTDAEHVLLKAHLKELRND